MQKLYDLMSVEGLLPKVHTGAIVLNLDNFVGAVELSIIYY
jgi:hypothetical protein